VGLAPQLLRYEHRHPAGMCQADEQVGLKALHLAADAPALRTNLGQEKHGIYHERFKSSPPAYCCGECCDGDPDRLGHFLAWIAGQQPWLETLQAQIQAAHPGTPSRLLVVDDLFGGYRTCFIALGLLETLYPQAEVSMVAGSNDLTNDFVDAWLLEFVPALSAEVTPDAEANQRIRYPNPWHEQLKPLITGSEDISPPSLELRPLGCDSAAVQALAGLADLDTILAAPAWALSLATQYALQRQRGEIPAPQGVDLEDDPASPDGRLSIAPAERLFRLSWLHNGIPPAEAARLFTGLPGGLTAGLKSIRYCLQAHGKGRGRLYFPGGAAESWITAYNPAEWSRFAEQLLPISGFSEIIPGKLWAGAHPPGRREVQENMFRDLLQRGVRRLFDLTGDGELHANWPYLEALSQVSGELGIPVERVSFPLRFGAAPTRQQMRSLLDLLDSLMNAGMGVYLHAGHNLEGRTPLVLACLLIDQGHPPQQALSQVTDTWLQILPYLIRLPMSDGQRQFVLRWRREQPA
jgi:hypothetical protein